MVDGIRLPAKGWLVPGTKICTGPDDSSACEKSPCRSSAVGTVSTAEYDCRERVPVLRRDRIQHGGRNQVAGEGLVGARGKNRPRPGRWEPLREVPLPL